MLVLTVLDVLHNVGWAVLSLGANQKVKNRLVFPRLEHR